MTLNISNLDLSGKSVFIVEDDQPSVMYYETLLRNSGCELFVCRTGREFTEYFSEAGKKVDMVFMDFLVPLVNGIECTRFFRKNYRSVPVVMVTAYSSEQTKQDALIAGCNEFVLKPVYPEKVFSLLEKYLLSETGVLNHAWQ
ncbi:MAG: response regulator [Bacteroidales bacterium]|jgi:CheY-like chemotaxis protein|nr:response regulator [Bacteroidales bacterium]